MKTKKTILVLSLLCTILSTAFVSGYTAEEIAAYEYSYKNNIIGKNAFKLCYKYFGIDSWYQ